MNLFEDWRLCVLSCDLRGGWPCRAPEPRLRGPSVKDVSSCVSSRFCPNRISPTGNWLRMRWGTVNRTNDKELRKNLQWCQRRADRQSLLRRKNGSASHPPRWSPMCRTLRSLSRGTKGRTQVGYSIGKVARRRKLPTRLQDVERFAKWSPEAREDCWCFAMRSLRNCRSQK